MNSANYSQYESIIDEYDVSAFEKDVPSFPLKFDFELDEYQKRSIYRLSQKQSVFVSVPTSAGKTVIALYAIAQCKQEDKCAIYTSPIKSLSNQKFREFSNIFGKVGILTGDISLNRDASILIMTTEILRSMLYKKDPLLKKVSMVIFDEFHYIANQERGNVWEESVILMPKHISMAFLSASMPNSEQIANWISKTKEQSIYIEMHNKRPVPLNHCIYLNDEITTISDNQKKGELFDSYKLRRAKRNHSSSINTRSNQYLMGLILNLQSKKLLPALMFEFSIRTIETKTDAISNCVSINLLSNEEQKYVIRYFNKVMKRFPEEDRDLPQIKKMFNLLKCGVAFHHSGVLPILKETVEILLSEGYVKLVFCTSTIGMGLNLPVRTCCFTNIQKYNGKEYIYLTSTEYQQMSGRAGRRGKDDVGTSILCVGKKFPREDYLKDLFTGEPEIIKSQFQINFKIVLNSISELSGMNINDILRKSFLESVNNSKFSDLNAKIEKEKSLLFKMKVKECTDIEDAGDEVPINSFVSSYENIHFVNSQIIEKYSDEFENALKIGMLVLYMNRPTFIIAMINDIDYLSDKIQKISILSSKGDSFDITENDFEYLHLLSSPASDNIDTMSIEEKIEIIEQFNFRDNLSEYKEMIQINDDEFIEHSDLHHQIILDVLKSPCLKCNSITKHLVATINADNLRKKIENEEETLYKKEFEEYESYLKVLEELHYINKLGDKYTLGFKGIVANEIYGHEIISTEIFSSDIFNNCTLEEIAALCSCFVAQRSGRNNDFIEYISPKINKKVNKMREIVKKVEKQLKNNSIPYDEDDFLDLNINPNAMYPVYLWAKGESFSKIMRNSQKILEGQMVSIITKVFSLLSNFSEVAKKMENCQLADLFLNSAKKLERGIVFAKSIYLYDDL